MTFWENNYKPEESIELDYDVAVPLKPKKEITLKTKKTMTDQELREKIIFLLLELNPDKPINVIKNEAEIAFRYIKEGK